MIRRRHMIRTKTFNVGGHDGVSRADFVATVANRMNVNTSNIVRMTRKECPQPWAHKYPVPADIRMQVDGIEQYLEYPMMDVLAGITRSLDVPYYGGWRETIMNVEHMLWICNVMYDLLFH